MGKMIVCPECHGLGQVNNIIEGPFLIMQETCDLCGGQTVIEMKLYMSWVRSFKKGGQDVRY